jgi:CubicO group peptidase (beta-lactamase class C family)
MTFGHLGFTGTSIWIDPQKKKGHVILTNATKKYYYDRQGLNDLRRQIGEAIWI